MKVKSDVDVVVAKKVDSELPVRVASPLASPSQIKSIVDDEDLTV